MKYTKDVLPKGGSLLNLLYDWNKAETHHLVVRKWTLIDLAMVEHSFKKLVVVSFSLNAVS